MVSGCRTIGLRISDLGSRIGATAQASDPELQATGTVTGIRGTCQAAFPFGFTDGRSSLICTWRLEPPRAK